MRKLVEFQVLDCNANHYGIDLSDLMDNAGRGIADYISNNYNLDKKDFRCSVIDSIISPLELSQYILEADDQDILSKYIEIYGPKINMMIDHDRLLKMEAAMLRFGPSQFLWGKVVRF